MRLADECPPIGGLPSRNCLERDKHVGGVEKTRYCIDGSRAVIAPARDLAGTTASATAKAVIRGLSLTADDNAPGGRGSGELDKTGARIAPGTLALVLVSVKPITPAPVLFKPRAGYDKL